MPSEVRHLIFSPSETLTAIYELRRRWGRPLCNGIVRTAEIVGTPDTGCRLIIAPRGGGGEQEYLINAAELGAALVFFCVNRGVPLPAAATKTLRISGDALVLVIDTGTSPAARERPRCAAEPCGAMRPTAVAPAAGPPLVGDEPSTAAPP